VIELSSDSQLLQSVAGIALRPGKVFLAKRRSGGNVGGKWEFPGGKVETGETPQEALSREFMEELGVAIHVGELIGTNRFRSGERQFTLAAYEVVVNGTPRPGPEHESSGWFDLSGIAEIDMPDSDRGLIPQLLRFAAK